MIPRNQTGLWQLCLMAALGCAGLWAIGVVAGCVLAIGVAIYKGGEEAVIAVFVGFAIATAAGAVAR